MAALGATVTARQNEPLDLLVWRALGRGSPAYEAVLAANPGLAASAHALAEGQAVLLPAAVAVEATVPVVQLWD